MNSSKNDGNERIEYVGIVAMCEANRGIGKNNTLPWSVPDDYNYFMRVVTTTRDKRKTNAMLMGRFTWDSIPVEQRPILPGLTVIVSSKMTPADIRMRPDASVDSVIILKSIDESLQHIRANYADKIEAIYCLGGTQLYKYEFDSFDF